MIKLFFIFFTLAFSQSFLLLTSQIIEKEIDNAPKISTFIDNDSKTFIATGENYYLIDNDNSKLVYSKSLEDYLEEGVYTLIGNNFLFAEDDETLKAIDIITGKEKWVLRYDDLDQENFKAIYRIANDVMLQYNNLLMGMDTEVGKTTGGNIVYFNTEILMAGGKNLIEFPEINKFIVIEDEKVRLLSSRNLADLCTIYNFEPNIDLIRNGIDWYYLDNDSKYIFFCSDDYLIGIDLIKNREIYRREFDFEDNINPFLNLGESFLAFGEEKILLFNSMNAKANTLEIELDDFRTYSVIEYKNKKYLLASLENQLINIDLQSGEIIWKTDDEELYKGYAHKYLGIYDNKLITTFAYGENPPNGGTWIRVVAFDFNSGEHLYSTDNIIHCSQYINSFSRSVVALAGWDDKTSIANWSNLGFNYSEEIIDEQLYISNSNIVEMWNPDTDEEEGGDGLVVVDLKNGNILFKDYLILNDYGTPPNPKAPKRLESKYVGNLLIIPGNIKTAIYDIVKLKRISLSDSYEEYYITDAAKINDDIIMKYGTIDFNIRLEPPGLIGWFGASIEVNKNVEIDPFGFISINSSNGKINWNQNIEQDPAFSTTDFSIENFYSEITNSLAFSDEENLYSLSNKGNIEWKINYEEQGIGEIPYDEIYSVKEIYLSHEFTSKTVYEGYNYDYIVTKKETYTSEDNFNKYLNMVEDSDLFITYKSGNNTWGATAKKTLGIYISDTEILILGSEAIARIDRKNGQIKWKHKWDYDSDDVSVTPVIVGNYLIYSVSGKMEILDLKSGKVKQSSDATDDCKLAISPSGKYIYLLTEDFFKGFILN